MTKVKIYFLVWLWQQLKIWYVSSMSNYDSLKDELLKKIVICLIESPFEMTKNAFYFILKVLSVLKVFKILSWLFGHVGKTAWLGR